MPSDFLEKTLEDIVYENRYEIHNRGLCRIKRTAFRQVYLPSGRKIDILAYDLIDGHLYFDIFELKKDCINTEAVAQAINYLDEINQLIKGAFRGHTAKIIMVGRKCEQMPFLDYLTVPVSVYTYDYQMEGISFACRNCRGNYYSPHENFSLGVWAWGLNMLSLTNGTPSTMSFHSSITRHLDGGNFETILRETKATYLREQKLLPEPITEITPLKPVVSTVIFPEQPAWTLEFSSQIPFGDDLMEDIEEDLCDYEPEIMELDECDFEANGDDEPDYYENFDNSLFFLEPLRLPELYFVAKLK